MVQGRQDDRGGEDGIFSCNIVIDLFESGREVPKGSQGVGPRGTTSHPNNHQSIELTASYCLSCMAYTWGLRFIDSEKDVALKTHLIQYLYCYAHLLKLFITCSVESCGQCSFNFLQLFILLKVLVPLGYIICHLTYSELIQFLPDLMSNMHNFLHLAPKADKGRVTCFEYYSDVIVNRNGLLHPALTTTLLSLSMRYYIHGFPLDILHWNNAISKIELWKKFGLISLMSRVEKDKLYQVDSSLTMGRWMGMNHLKIT